jgi:hypothetical protein
MAKAIEKLKAIAKARSSAQALKKWAESGGDVPLKYKGREHVWAKKVKKFAEGGLADNTVPDMADGGRIIDGPAFKDGGAAFGQYTTGKKYQGAKKRAETADVNTLADPRTYAFVSGLLGEAPDELGFSVMHPDYEGIQKVGEKGFMGGTILGVAPAVAPLTKGLPVGAAIRPVGGGNFLTGSVDKALKPLKTRTIAGETPAQRIPRHEALLSDPSLNKDQIDRVLYQLEETKKEAAIDQWVNRNLTNYVKKQMATPDDPVRKLAEEGIVHTPDLRVASYMAPQVRKHYGTEQLGKSQQAKSWEDAADVKISGIKIKDLKPDLREPWMDKADPETLVYHGPMLVGDINNFSSGLGFDHIVDVLKQDLAAGRIRPEQLNKVSMEQAVRRTYDFDQDMAKKMREAAIKQTEGMPVHKEYPEGYRWIELGPGKELPEGWTTKNGAYYDPKGERHVHPDSEKVANALKYEGDTMGHCVGGYCPDVLEGRSRIYSLRDAKNEPHVTVEVQPAYRNRGFREGEKPSGDEYYKLQEQYLAGQKAGGVDPNLTFAEWYRSTKGIAEPPEPAPVIKQIKGKQNKAPNEQYLPFVQDFVRSGKWSDVGDFGNTGLIHRLDLTPDERKLLPQDTQYLTMDEVKKLREGKPWTPIDRDPELDINLDDLGMKKGGAVGCGCNDEPKMAAGGVAKAIKGLLSGGKKAEKVEHPLVFPRATPKTKEEIRPIAQRVAEQMTGEFVRQNPKVTTNPAGKSRKQFERERNIPLETRNVVPERPAQAVDYEKLKDYAIVGVPGDPSMGGVAKAGSLGESAKPTVELTRVGDITPDSPVPLFGGPRFGDDEKFWASNIGAAKPIQTNVTELSEFYDSPVLGKYIKMAPDSANFAIHNLDSLLAIQRPERLSPGKMEQLNKVIREGSPKYGKFPNFPGFDDPVDVLLQSQLNSKLRKHIAETLTKPTITDELGLPNGLDVVTAITHPELRNLETGVSGFSVGRMQPGAVLRAGESSHPTYDTDIPGAMIGRSKYPTPYEIAFPDTTAYARSQLKPGVQEFNMMKLLGPRERIDQQYIDEMKMFEELMKQYTGKKKGGAVGGLSAVEKV